MDVEKQGNRSSIRDFSFRGIQENVKEKAKHPSVSSTLIVFLILNIIMLIFGCIHVRNCPLEKMVPIYLIVAGAIGIVSKLLPFVNRKLDMRVITIIIYILYVIELVWMILGSYWVYGIPRLNFDNTRRLYCNKTVYYIAFWWLTMNWVLLGITILFACCAAVCIAILNRRSK